MIRTKESFWKDESGKWYLHIDFRDRKIENERVCRKNWQLFALFRRNVESKINRLLFRLVPSSVPSFIRWKNAIIWMHEIQKFQSIEIEIEIENEHEHENQTNKEKENELINLR